MPTEYTLVSKLLKVLRQEIPLAVIFKLADRFSFGIPDICITFQGLSSWWECKHANPNFKSMGIQELTATRLANNGICFYIIYDENNGDLRTLIVEPCNISSWATKPFAVTYNFDHKWVVDQIRKIHDATTKIV